MPDVLHYRGDLTASIDRDQMIGPDFGKRWLGIRDVTYNPANDISTVRLRGILPDEYRQRIEPMVAEARARARIHRLFHGE
jgi:hypothetical protein